jgi:hypothetical protein
LVQAGFHAGTDGLTITQKALAEAALEAEASAEVAYGSLSVEASGSAKLYAEARASASMGFTDTGVSGEISAFAGAGVDLGGSASVSLGAMTASLDAAVSIGLQVGFEVSGEVGYEDGILTFAFAGDLALVLGISLDFEFTVDVDAIGEDFENSGFGVMGKAFSSLTWSDVSDMFSFW